MAILDSDDNVKVLQPAYRKQPPPPPLHPSSAPALPHPPKSNIHGRPLSTSVLLWAPAWSLWACLWDKRSLFSSQEKKMGWLAGWLVGRSVGWLVGWSAGWLVGWLVGWVDGWMHGRSVGRSVGCSFVSRDQNNWKSLEFLAYSCESHYRVSWDSKVQSVRPFSHTSTAKVSKARPIPTANM